VAMANSNMYIRQAVPTNLRLQRERIRNGVQNIYMGTGPEL
jgi:hypothetical protein